MNVLLVNPGFPETTFWGYKYALRFIGKKATLPPLGLITVAAMLPRKWSKRLVDVNVQSLTDSDLDWADSVFITSMNIQRKSTIQTIARCKAAGLTVVAGGPLFTSEHREFEDVDHFVLNEAELTLPAFVEDFEKGCAKRVYDAEGFCDMGRTPAPLWELVDMNRYASMSIQFSRGCPFNCDFCNVTTLFGRKHRLKSAEQIIAELDRIYSLGWRDKIFFVDDNFIVNRKYLKTRLLPALIQWQRQRKGLQLYTEASIDLADDRELMSMMREAGFDTVFIGIETPEEGGLAECSKNQNKNRDLIKDVLAIQKAGLQVMGGFIVGFDSDTSTTFKRQIEFIQKSGIVVAMVGLLQAAAGTGLYKRLKSEGRIIGSSTGDNTDGTTNIVPKMGIDSLSKGYKSILNHIYSPEYYYQRVKTFLQNYRPPKFESPFSLESVRAGVRGFIRLGITGAERFYFWKLFAWTLFRKPELLKVMLALAVVGHHFRKIGEDLGV